jgi:predicted dithiol-disulfide oxidoreductase (DUF899 family)
VAAHKVVSHDEWIAARKKHLRKEKEFTHLRDQLSRERRGLPWELVDRDYTFESERGKMPLHDLFEGRSQLVIYHAMFNPDTAGPDTTWTADAACFACSWWLDHFDGITVHLHHRDITIAAVSIAPYPAIAAYKERMGWSFPWYSSAGSDFNFDYQVSFTPEQVEAGKAEYNYQVNQIGGSESPGVSVFLKEGDTIYHTYSTYTRGLDMLNLTYHYIDLTPKGRGEGPGGLGEWVRRHDEYPD